MSESDVLRIFLAVEISERARKEAARLIAHCKQAGARVSWTAPEKLHLTLNFLGDTFRARLAELSEMLDCAAAETPPFSYDLAGTGIFGSPRSPRVLWVGVRDVYGGLARLQSRLSEGIQALGVMLEKRPFLPHLTLGRVRSAGRADELTSALQSANNTHFGTVEVRRVLMMQSHLGHQGVRYSVYHESKLKGAQ